MPGRRDFLLKTVRNAGLAIAGGAAWGGIIEQGKAAPLAIRPPGALPEEEFIAKCIKCGMCAEACPYDSLKLTAPGYPGPPGTPYYIPRETPCYMCTDIPCVPACPSGALDSMLVSILKDDGSPALDINKSKMGLAVIDRNSCIAYSEIQCDACYRACPLIDSAITIDLSRNERTGKHALHAPVVHSNVCTGCGLCEKACVTSRASIFILPVKLATGETGSRYLTERSRIDQKTIDNADEGVTTMTPRSSKKAVDYLNEEEF
ncbi:MAG: ferredoxin-type protein NapG [Nitrospira sp.]|nr:ferredoxin-type protein NapG [bacterium]MBL7048957.1 ferredoxin-type protein NapG [Nitrospira sp.]